MSTQTTLEKETLKGAASNYFSRIKSGDIGSLPAVLGLRVAGMGRKILEHLVPPHHEVKT